ncbi:MAG: hypothetical protein AAGF12_40775 [Myxococcota bacterium]
MSLRRIAEVALHAVLPLGIGAALYLGGRSDQLLGYRWGRALGIHDIVGAIRSWLRPLADLPEWICFSLPDALWVYAFVWSMAKFAFAARGLERTLLLSVPVAMGVGAEFGQAIGVVPGTFDIVDLALCGLATALGLVTARPRELAGGRSGTPEPV